MKLHILSTYCKNTKFRTNIGHFVVGSSVTTEPEKLVNRLDSDPKQPRVSTHFTVTHNRRTSSPAIVNDIIYM